MAPSKKKPRIAAKKTAKKTPKKDQKADEKQTTYYEFVVKNKDAFMTIFSYDPNKAADCSITACNTVVGEFAISRGYLISIYRKEINEDTHDEGAIPTLDDPIEMWNCLAGLTFTGGLQNKNRNVFDYKKPITNPDSNPFMDVVRMIASVCEYVFMSGFEK